MTWYADPAAPRLSDFLIDRRVTMDDGHWPFGSPGPIRLISGGIWNAEVNRWEDAEFDIGLGVGGETSWADVIYNRRTASNWSMSGLGTGPYNVTFSGTPSQRQEQLWGLFQTRYSQIGVDPSNFSLPDWYVSGISYYADMTGIGGELAYVCAGDDQRAGSDYIGEYQDLIWDGEAGYGTIRPGWQTSVANWLDDKIENNGWRFYRPWQTFPTVRPLMHSGYLSTSRSEGYMAGPDWMMGVDFWSLPSFRIGEKVPWVKFTQMQDLRDPNDPNWATTPWYPQVGFSGTFPSRLNVGLHYTPDGSAYRFVETLNGDRPTTGTQAGQMLGLDTQINASIPGLVADTGGGYIDSWFGWQEPSEPMGGKSMRLYYVIAQSSDLLGCTSMEDLLAKPNVKIAFTAELHPYAEVGPASESVFEPTTFEAEPSGQVMLRMTVGDVWDGGGP